MKLLPVPFHQSTRWFDRCIRALATRGHEKTQHANVKRNQQETSTVHKFFKASYKCDQNNSDKRPQLISQTSRRSRWVPHTYSIYYNVLALDVEQPNFHLLEVRLVREWMYLTVCPFRGPGNDGSVGELMHLTACPHLGPGSIPGHGGVFQGISPWLITRGCKQKVS